MNEPQKNIKNENLVEIKTNVKFKSSPIVKENKDNQSNQCSIPENSEELENELAKAIDNKDIKSFRQILSKCYNLLSRESFNYFLDIFIDLYKKGQIYSFILFQSFLEAIKNPNIILDVNEKKQSLLMFFCEYSNYKMVSILCQKKIELDVNYVDITNRNAIFYLKGGNDDKNIIELLVKKNININHKDNEGNTALHYFLINNPKVELICNLIDIGKANFMLKNNQNKSCLELIYLNLISKKNVEINNQNQFNFKEINKLIQLIKKNLSINSGEVDIINNKDFMLPQKTQSQNLIKIPILSFNKKNLNEVNKNDEDYLNNIYLSLKKNPSLIIDTQTNYNDKKINNLSTSQTLEYFNQINKNKKSFLNYLKNSEIFLSEKTKSIKAYIEEKKKELKNKKIELDLINQINYNGLNLIKINSEMAFLKKFQNISKEKEKNKNFICNQLTIDLMDYYIYIIEKNKLLSDSIKDIHDILEDSVKDCLGNGYEARIYGSRQTGTCLPWSDIDFVIVLINEREEFYDPLNMLYQYLKRNAPFIETIKYIPNTKVPIIKIVTKKEYHKLGLDISMELSEHHGQQCISYISGKTKEYKPLVPLTLALKTIFYNAQIHNPYTGGLSSYGIILLIIYFLDIEKKKGKTISYNNIGTLFFELLLFYKDKEKFNVNRPIILTEKYNHLALLQMIQSEYSFIIVDPLNPYNNVAKNVRQLNKIINTFEIAVKSLFDGCECGCHYQHSYCLLEEKCNHNLLNNIFNAVKTDDAILDKNQ